MFVERLLESCKIGPASHTTASTRRPALTSTDPVAVSITKAIHTGDVAALRQLLSDDPGLANVRIVGADGVERSMVHVATDWPGRLPNVATTLRALASAGAHVNARMPPHPREIASTLGFSRDR